MDEKTFSTLFQPEKILEIPHGSAQQQILRAENCFNPFIVILRSINSTMEIPLLEYNRNYFEHLTSLRQAIEAVDLKGIVCAINQLHYHGFAFNDDQNFIDFLTFSGLFHGCQWFKNVDPAGFPQDLICSVEGKPEKIELVPFLNNGQRPKDKLQELFDGREDVETDKIGGLNFENPFSFILCGKYSVDYKDFDNAIECLKNEKFIAKWREQKEALKKTQSPNGIVIQQLESSETDRLTDLYGRLPDNIKTLLMAQYKPADTLIPEALALLAFKDMPEKARFMEKYAGHWIQKNRAAVIGTSEQAYSRDKKK